MATFSKTTALSSRKYASEQGMNIQDLSKKHWDVFGRTTPFLLEKNNFKIKIFRVFLPLGDPLVSTFNTIRRTSEIIFIM